MKRGSLAFDLRDILAALGPQAVKAVWRVGDVEVESEALMMATGNGADELEKLAKLGMLVSGERLIEIARNVDQIIWGEFKGYDSASSADPWIVVVAFDSTWFEVRSTDDLALARLEVAFKDVRPLS